jgi:teichuronic acid biosynthesis glycosyltransferase TuaG
MAAAVIGSSKNNMEEISVIIPVYNGEKTLLKAINSCLNQTLPPIEILVCDDGSTDDSKKIVEEIDNNKVIWIPNPHTGAPAIPRNNGLRSAKGNWIAFCDSDDEWLPSKLEKQIAVVKKFKCKASSTNALIKIGDKITDKTISSFSKSKISFADLLKNNEVVCSSAMIHSSVFKKIGGFPEESEYRSFEDYIYWLRVSTDTPFAFVDEPLVIYDDHPATSIRSFSPEGNILRKIALKNLIFWLKNNKLYIYFLKAQGQYSIDSLKKTLRNRM